VLDPYAVAEVPSLAAPLRADLGGPAPVAAAPAAEPAAPAVPAAAEEPDEAAPQLGLF